MRRTVPQVIMLNHATWKQHKQSEADYEARKDKEPEDNPYAVGNKRVDELEGDELNKYLGDWDGFA